MRAARTAAKPPEHDAPVAGVTARAYRIPTESPEADGTIAWEATTLVVAQVAAGGQEGIGYSYASRACLAVIEDMLKPALMGLNAFDIPRCWQAMCAGVRNVGRSGIAACAISAVDNALWDVKAKLLGVPLIALLGAARERIPVYGSGGFTTYGPQRIVEQIEGWRDLGIGQYKIKIGRDKGHDTARIEAAADALPEGGKLFVDANGAYHPKQALAMAKAMMAYEIAWFEEPVSSDDIAGLRFVRGHAPPSMDIAGGEYGYNADDFRRLLEGGAVDVLQADATRCLGITGFLQAIALSESHHCPLSSHCAPALHAPLMCHAGNGRHIEYFSDHVRIERMLLDGAPEVKDGCLAAQNERPGFGFTLKAKDAERFAV